MHPIGFFWVRPAGLVQGRYAVGLMAASRQVLPEAADQDTTTLRTLEQSANLPPMVIRWAFPTNLFLFVCLSGLGMPSIVAASTPEPLTVAQAQTLPTHELAEQIFGERIADKVIEAVRYEYPGRVPRYIEFYTMPELTNPRINGICRTDVITAEYELDNTVSGTPRPSSILNVTHVQAMGRYKAFVVPPGEPGTPENDRAQAKACARMTTALDAFHAPSAGDAQWLAAIEAEYLDPKQRFSFSCDDFSDKSCAKAKQKLSRLKLSLAKKVKSITCSKKNKGDQIDLCYQLSFPYPGEECSGLQDSSDFECGDLEWVLTVFAGMEKGDSPVRILSLHLEHQRQAIGIP